MEFFFLQKRVVEKFGLRNAGLIGIYGLLIIMVLVF